MLCNVNNILKSPNYEVLVHLASRKLLHKQKHKCVVHIKLN